MMKKTFEITGSSRIIKVVMDDETRDITITFKGEKVYQYNSVSEFDFRMFKEDIQNGESVGKSFEKRIRNKYAGKKIMKERDSMWEAAKPLFILYGTASIILLIFSFICWIFNLKL